MLRLSRDALVCVLLSLSAAFQSTYLLLSSRLPLLPAQAVLSATLLFLFLPKLVRVIVRGRSAGIFFLLLTLYLAVLSVFLSTSGLTNVLNDWVANFIFFACGAFLAERRGVPAEDPNRDQLVLYLVIGVLFVTVLAHLPVFFSGGFDVNLLVSGFSAGRYGFTDERNLVNVTGANIGFVLIGSYIYLRSLRMNAVMLILILLSLSLLIPIAATGSRSALLSVLATLFLFEAWRFKREFSSKALRALLSFTLFSIAFLVGFNFLFIPSQFSEIFTSSIERLRFLFISGDEGRVTAIAYALDTPDFLFGSLAASHESSFAARDNVFANMVLTYGIVGFVLFAGTLASASAHSMRKLADFVPLMGIFLAPILIQSLSEGAFVVRSTIFTTLFYWLVLTEVSRRNLKTPGA